MQTKNNSIFPDDSNTINIQISEQSLTILNLENSSYKIIPINRLHQNLDEIWELIRVDKYQIKLVHVEIVSADFLLLPVEYDSPVYRNGFLEKSLGEKRLMGQEISVQEINLIDSNLIFCVPSTWKDTIANLFSMSKIIYRHILGNIVSQKKEKQVNSYSFCLHQNLLFVTLFKNNRLELANAFPYQSAVELAFYIHSLRESFELNLRPDLVNFSGPESNNELILSSLKDFNIHFQNTKK